MNNKRVFIIEDEEADYKIIKNQVIPQGLDTLFISDNSVSCEFTDKETDALNMFKSTDENSLHRSMNFIADIIRSNHETIRLIICDLRINANATAGRQIIEMIRNKRIPNFDKDWFCEDVPIVIISRLTDQDKLDAYARATRNCFFLSKDTAFTKDGASLLGSIVYRLAEQFDDSYRKHVAKKRYKIALSFTNSNIAEDGKELKIRSFIQELANGLYAKYSGGRVFYDMDKQEESNAKDKYFFADTYNNAEYVVVFISEGYKNKTSRWSTAEWEVIKSLDMKNKVIFVAIDSTLKESDFKKCLGINEVIYKDMIAWCSQYNQLLNADEAGIINFVKDGYWDRSIAQMMSNAIRRYKEESPKIIKEAVEFIDKTIKIREERIQ